MRHEFPDAIRRFILTSIPSVPYLEAMLLLRAEPGQAWDAALAARRLYISQQRAGELLRNLAEAGIAVPGPNGGWNYGPDPALAALIDEVARLYSLDLVGVANLIHARNDSRARQFADAFRFRKDK